jgi:hypothetical protein
MSPALGSKFTRTVGIFEEGRDYEGIPLAASAQTGSRSEALIHGLP